MLCKDGTYKWILTRGKASLNPDGSPHRMVGSITDISMRKALEFKLLEQRNFNRSLVDSANSIIAVMNRDGVMIDINPFGERFSGYTKEEIASEPFFWARLLPKDIQPKVLEIIDRAKEGYIVERFQNSWISKDGVEKVFEWSNAIIYDDKGEMEYVTTIGVDVSQIKEQEKELIEAKDFAEKATAAKSDFLANMSHEIRTPLNGIIGLTNLVLETDLNEVQKNYLNKSIASSKALLHIINDILDYSKIESGKIEIEHISFELDTTLHQIYNIFTYEAQQKGVQLNCIMAPIIDNDLIGDPFRISQILINLVGNALKFTHEGFINININIEKISENTLKLIFDIKDRGGGIAKEKQRKLFK
jgi:PAS domain S-box-containing protein